MIRDGEIGQEARGKCECGSESEKQGESNGMINT